MFLALLDLILFSWVISLWGHEPKRKTQKEKMDEHIDKWLEKERAKRK